jgi:hypothetical protein
VVEGIAEDAHFPVERFKDHPTVACRDRTGFIRTLRDLLADGLSPRMVILESGVPPSRLADREIEWIALLFALGYGLDNFLTARIAERQELFERDLRGRPSLTRSWRRIIEELLEEGESRTISAEKASEFRHRLVERFALNPWEGELPSWTKRHGLA